MKDEPLQKNSLQSIVDSIQAQEKSTRSVEDTKGYVPNPELKTLRTFQGDMQGHIEEKKETIATIVLAEQKKKIERNEPLYTEKPSSTGASLKVLLGVFLLMIGGVVLGGIYFLNSQKTPNTTSAVDIERTLIPYTQKKDILVKKADVEDIASPLLQEKSLLSAPVNTVLYTKFVFESKQLETLAFVTALAPSASDALRRNINAYMAGIYSYDTAEPFIILEPDDFGIVYSGMLEWESGMGKDLSPFFPKLENYLQTNPSVFTDETYKNKDVRVIRDQDGAALLLYGFIDKKTLVITSNEKIFEAILTKYLNSQLRR